jgi:hypothetical protein
VSNFDNQAPIIRLESDIESTSKSTQSPLRLAEGNAHHTARTAAVSQKREYFNYLTETIGDFALRLRDFGAWRPSEKLQKPAIGGDL